MEERYIKVDVFLVQLKNGALFYHNLRRVSNVKYKDGRIIYSDRGNVITSYDISDVESAEQKVMYRDMETKRLYDTLPTPTENQPKPKKKKHILKAGWDFLREPKVFRTRLWWALSTWLMMMGACIIAKALLHFYG